MRFNAHPDTSHYRPQHPFKDAGIVADTLTGIQNAPVKCLLLSTGAAHTSVSGVPTGKNPEDSNLARVEAMQWVRLYLSMRYDGCH
jgi:hypothetical protein